MEKLNVLILDDEPDIRNEIEEFLVEKNFTVYQTGLPSIAFSVFEERCVDVAIVDIRLPEMNGIEVLERIKKFYPSTEVIMITGYGEMETVIHSMRLGAIDFFNKPFLVRDLDRTIEKAKVYCHFQRELKSGNHDFSLCTGELEQLIGLPIIGESSQMKGVMKFANKVATTKNTNVLITGECGTGKELIAKSIHYLSNRKKNPFHSVNCASIPEELFESEFFGHTKGAFTGAISEKIGWFEASHKGTLFMDEIGDLKLSSQPKFLRVLDDMTITRIGSTRPNKVDVRVIAATNQSLEKKMENKLFRQDLFYRLNSFTIHIPPLRERKEDIIPLFHYFLRISSIALDKTIQEVDPRISSWLLDYNYPGNIRELKHMVESALILCQGSILTLKHFRKQKNKLEIWNSELNIPSKSLYESEKKSIIQALKETHFVKTQAARLLKISRQALDRKMEKYKIN